MTLDAVTLAQEIIAIPSPSAESNVPVMEHLERLLTPLGFAIERVDYIDVNGIAKRNLVARLGPEPPRGAQSGFALFSHSDTVPGDAGWEPFAPVVKDGRLYGRGACDMKGPLAATVAAASAIDPAKLRRPFYLIITADEEVGYPGAKRVASDSTMLADRWPEHGVIAEPTRLRPVFAHKGGTRIFVTAEGVAAHTSTDRGISANFIIAPFLAEMASLVPLFRNEPRFRNDLFDPPTNGFNMVINDGNCASNVTAARTNCILSLRTMPGTANEEMAQIILDAVKRHNLKATWYTFDPFIIDRDAEIVRAAEEATGTPAESVPFGTEAAIFKDYTQLVILGPGDIAQAHTVGEWIDVAQLRQSVEVYRKLIERFCYTQPQQ
jgi:acetylornithine deacetylase